MEINNARPATAELASLAAASVQKEHFKDRKKIEAQSVVRNEAVYFSPVIRIDKDTQTAVIQFRDGQTGEVQNEYPKKSKLDAYEHARETVPPEAQEVVAEVEKAEKPAPKEPVFDEKA